MTYDYHKNPFVPPPVKPFPPISPPYYHPKTVASDIIKDPRQIRSWFKAYRLCCIRKENKKDCAMYRGMVDFDLLRLANEVYQKTYTQGQCQAFIMEWPKPREIFIPDFRDRIVQYWLVKKIKPLLEERYTLQGDVSYCERKKSKGGTDKALRDIKSDIIVTSENYTKEAWVGKFDISNCFMSIPREKLKKLITAFIRSYYIKDDKDTILWLLELFIDHYPTENFIYRTGKIRWNVLKPGRSFLKQEEPGKGLSVGDYLNSVLVNFYLSVMDDFILTLIKRNGGGYYRRYMDDFVITMPRRSNLKKVIREVREWLPRKLGITLHPDKVYIQEVRKGIKILGHVIKPSRQYTGNRTIGGLYNNVYAANQVCMKIYNEMNKRRRYQRNILPELKLLGRYVLAINSYLGLLKQSATYNIRTKVFEKAKYPYLHFVCMVVDDYKKILIKDKYNLKKYILWQHTKLEQQNQTS